MTRVRTAAVIGGGIAGPVAALALRKAGIEATVYEAYPSTAHGIGGGIALAPNGMAALEIVDAAAGVAVASRTSSRMVMTIGRKRLELPRPADVGPLHIVQRSDLYRVLHDAAIAHGIRVEYGKRLVDAHQTAGSAVAVFADDSRAEADVLIGADGVHSRVRRLIDPDAPGPRYTGMLGFEGRSSWEVPGDPETMTFAFGKRGYYLYWQAPGGGTTWGVNLPQVRPPMTLTEARGVPKEQWMRTMRDVYGADDPGGSLMRNTDPDSLQAVGALHIMPKVPHWYRGRMVLVGDAVHAPSSSSGQGASLAIESAVQLARCLRDIEEPAHAFAAYERLRRPRVEGIAAAAAKINHAKAPGPVAQTLMPILLPLFMNVVMRPEKTIGPQQRYRIDWNAPVGKSAAIRT